MLGIPLALAAFNASEWLVHRYILHGLGRRKDSFWAFHWHEHHKNSRRAAMRDGDYERPIVGWHAQAKEALGLAAVALTAQALAAGGLVEVLSLGAVVGLTVLLGTDVAAALLGVVVAAVLRWAGM